MRQEEQPFAHSANTHPAPTREDAGGDKEVSRQQQLALFKQKGLLNDPLAQSPGPGGQHIIISVAQKKQLTGSGSHTK